MSLVQTAMFKDQLKQLGHHDATTLIKSRSHNELIQLNGSISTNLSNNRFNKNKRRFDEDNTTTKKRSRTAPPSPPPSNESSDLSSYTSSKSPTIDEKSSVSLKNLRSRSLSPVKRFFNPLSRSNSPSSLKEESLEVRNEEQDEQTVAPQQQSEQKQTVDTTPAKITLPSISTVLGTAEKFKQSMKLKSITPTVSLDYFDTYKPNDENWRYELLDKITKESRHFHLNQYNYLNKHAEPALPTIKAGESLSSSPSKPNFDSRISSKIKTNHSTMLPKLRSDGERKINFPYESNYTYLNKTYLNDVKKYPEYLELAQSLMSLSQPEQYNSSFSSTSSTDKTPLMKQHSFPQHSMSLPPVTYFSMNDAGASTGAAPPQYHNSSYVVTSPINNNYTTYHNGLPSLMTMPQKSPITPQHQQLNHKLIPFSPPPSSGNAKVASRSDLLKSPPRNQHHNHHHHHHHHNTPRVCISCGSDQSPCWRPSWSIKEGQLCNSCGLRYKKTNARCLNDACRKIPAKGEWSLMQSKSKHAFGDGIEGYSCLECGWRVEVKR
ncbi:Transcriptional regulatory protein ASH1 [Spathaspora sp. JA1]|nr:Transcriptional regulatory protein ASH1 [Spathaspora sp. JA1]